MVVVYRSEVSIGGLFGVEGLGMGIYHWEV